MAAASIDSGGSASKARQSPKKGGAAYAWRGYLSAAARLCGRVARVIKSAGQSLKTAARRVKDSGAAWRFGARGGGGAKARKRRKALIYKAFSPLRHAKNAPISDTDIGLFTPIPDADIGSFEKN